MGDSADGASASGDGLYGGAAAGILETNDLKFHHLHGRNARISNNGATASRPNALGEFNDAIIMSNRLHNLSRQMTSVQYYIPPF